MVEKSILKAVLIASSVLVVFSQKRVPFESEEGFNQLSREVPEIHELDTTIHTGSAASEIAPGDVVTQTSNVKPTTCSSARLFTFDGQCNHGTRRTLGAANSGFQALFTKIEPWELPRDIDLPSPRLVSNLVSHEDVSPPNKRGLSEFFTFTGQFVDHILAETHAAKVEDNIPIPADDQHLAPGGTISFNRSARVRVANGKTVPQNIISSFLDGSAIYGSMMKTVRNLRLYKDGLMKTSAGDLMPLNNNQHFMGGDVRANENPALQAMHTLWVREHNRIAKELDRLYPGKSDEWLFDIARRINVAELQQVVFNEFVPAMLGQKLPKYSGYKSYVDGSTSNEFATVAYRVGHTLVNPKLTVHYDGSKPVEKPLSEIFFITRFIRDHGISGVIKGILSKRAAEVDVGVTSELRNLLFPDMTNGGADLVALNIKRARDHSIPPYNRLRTFYGLRRKNSFHEITKNKKITKALHDVYLGDIDRIDAFIGGLAEDHYKHSSLGELFFTAWEAEFTRMRDGNRFHFENDQYMSFLPSDSKSRIPTLRNLYAEMNKIGGGTMRRILVENTKLQAKDVQFNPFLVKHAQDK